jgi:hypothetical protein
MEKRGRQMRSGEKKGEWTRAERERERESERK